MSGLLNHRAGAHSACEWRASQHVLLSKCRCVGIGSWRCNGIQASTQNSGYRQKPSFVRSPRRSKSSPTVSETRCMKYCLTTQYGKNPRRDNKYAMLTEEWVKLYRRSHVVAIINVPMSIKYLYSASTRRSNLRHWRMSDWTWEAEKKVRFRTGFKSSKTVRWADMQREKIPVIRWRYTKNCRDKRRFGTERNSKQMTN